MLCQLSLAKEFRDHFDSGRGPRREHSRSYVTDEERQPESKGAEIVSWNLAYRALECISILITHLFFQLKFQEDETSYPSFLPFYILLSCLY